jgi:hypothetical protein
MPLDKLLKHHVGYIILFVIQKLEKKVTKKKIIVRTYKPYIYRYKNLIYKFYIMLPKILK